MELLGSLVLFTGIAVLSYIYAKKKRITQEENLKKIRNNSQAQLSLLQEELERRANVVNKVESFLRSSKFIEPIATWKEDKIYKYIFNDGYLYEFEEFFSETNQRIGIDDDYLCFKQVCYRRVNNPSEFLNKFGSYF